MAENSDGSGAKKRGPGRPFQPGQSGNPGGRPKGFANAVKSVVGEEPVELAKIAFSIARGELQPGPLKRQPHDGESPADIGRELVAPKVQERIDALVFLRDTGFGKPVQAVDLDAEVKRGGVVIMLPPEEDDDDEPARGDEGAPP